MTLREFETVLQALYEIELNTGTLLARLEEQYSTLIDGEDA